MIAYRCQFRRKSTEVSIALSPTNIAPHFQSPVLSRGSYSNISNLLDLIDLLHKAATQKMQQNQR
ncbi:MAG: hypothetical protein ACRC62_19530 [Microcoleus sp.]